MQKNTINYYHILVVDNNQDNLTKIEFDLLEHNYHCTTADSVDQALMLIDKHVFHGVLINNSTLDEIQLLKSIRGHYLYYDLPVVVLADLTDEKRINLVLKNRANNIIALPYIPLLFINNLTQTLYLQQLKEELVTNLKKDLLTGLDNRISFTEFTRRAIAQNNRDPNSSLTVVLFDVDAFKTVNETYGYSIADDILKQIANIIVACFREYDLVARVNGEQFAVCMTCSDLNAAILASDRCRQKIAKTDFSQLNKLASKINISVCAGVASNMEHVCSFEQLMAMADKALHLAKNEGVNRLHCYQVNESKSDAKINQSNEKESMVDSVKYPGIDISIGLNNVLDDTDLFDEILIMFYQDHHQDAESLRKAISAGDIITAKHLAHTLKGVASSIGAMSLYEHAEVLDRSINQNDEQIQIMENYYPVEAELKKVFAGIYKELSQRIEIL